MSFSRSRPPSSRGVNTLWRGPWSARRKRSRCHFAPPVTVLEGRRVHYAAPVGTFPEVAEIILQRAREGGAVVPAGLGLVEAAGV